MPDATDDVLRTAVEKSCLGRARRLGKLLAIAASNSVPGRLSDSVATRLTSAVAQSACVRWLTSEPTGETVVVDLERTRTVGPVVRLLHRATATASRSYRASALRTVVRQWRRASTPIRTAVCQSTAWRLLGDVLKPPENPDRDP
ncbi:hypothetical protein [Haloarcula pellucida]|uniref:Uncharacterized protein n=1 Tax=Haloarcula pellucida TaxID=1427151 RepID=A0A830GLF2_9EURY|nr:hypothetical protein [Halomicroarcula pellucida]MBX0348756.1 hypothetical protein [Halomicroarcula pellucida]GGN91926.1 hypothetical protein GCM10009030_15530 [Halomicroarcula pellucida]